ncbi:hypothetical protein [Virgibacillus salexigens]|uniref:Uncharacterized protein n=1 Tax=Virgibacillus massiliensis TaxID=1462526 RepID=A0A024QIV3_9BACI|nr:hypothetical protein [Virgibacillus massiliensis]CDQ42125.1 hypothetical protein BN990_04505 [Virgibacillus massiliensis]
MLLRMNRIESSVLLLQMAISRKNVRNTFKRNYNKVESKELLSSFDEVKEVLEIEIEQTEEDQGEVLRDYHFNIKEIKMISSYLENYVPMLQNTAEQSGNMLEEDKQLINTLYCIRDRTKGLLDVVHA